MLVGVEEAEFESELSLFSEGSDLERVEGDDYVQVGLVTHPIIVYKYNSEWHRPHHITIVVW